MPLVPGPSTLTLDEIKLVQDSFVSVERAGPFVAENFFQQLFSYAPGLRTEFANDPWTHRAEFMRVIRGISAGLTRPEDFRQTTQNLAALVRTHAGNDLHYYVGAAWFSVLAQVLGSRFTQKIYAAWFKVFECFVNEVRSIAATSELSGGTETGEKRSTADFHATAA
jgi:hemoglobin-like flavoprotein